ncbi:MAG TPA: ThuA domain-containing protein [Gemmataceae bacterium]|jgi:trehalose utilization protein|nr:ThuA domain-containing protein [Gemmataceae bacterium]
MSDTPTRRDFLQTSAGAAATALLAAGPSTADDSRGTARAIKVVVWDEQQPAQKEAYDNFIGNQIAGHLRAQPGLSVKSVKQDDADQGLSADVLDGCRVLVWWGHMRQREVTPETGKKIVARIRSGALALIALHSAHWSTPFMEAMNERSRMDVERMFPAGGKEKVGIRYVQPPQRYTLPKADWRLTPYAVQRKFPRGVTKVAVHLPYCCFPAYRTDGKPSYVRVLKLGHPTVKGVPREFELPHTEMYDEPFHVPEPDEVILEERWAGGEWFRSGAVWTVGSGRVLYFRPGHETFPIYKDKNVLQILENAVRWLAGRK